MRTTYYATICSSGRSRRDRKIPSDLHQFQHPFLLRNVKPSCCFVSSPSLPFSCDITVVRSSSSLNSKTPSHQKPGLALSQAYQSQSDLAPLHSQSRFKYSFGGADSEDIYRGVLLLKAFVHVGFPTSGNFLRMRKKGCNYLDQRLCKGAVISGGGGDGCMYGWMDVKVCLCMFCMAW